MKRRKEKEKEKSVTNTAIKKKNKREDPPVFFFMPEYRLSIIYIGTPKKRNCFYAKAPF
jgi:hypothetical protein